MARRPYRGAVTPPGASLDVKRWMRDADEAIVALASARAVEDRAHFTENSPPKPFPTVVNYDQSGQLRVIADGGDIIELPKAPPDTIMWVRFAADYDDSALNQPVLKAGSPRLEVTADLPIPGEHNVMGLITDGQTWYPISAPLMTNAAGQTILPCPVIVNDAQLACIPVLQVKGFGELGMIYATHFGTTALLGLMMESTQLGLEEPNNSFDVTIGGTNDQQAARRRLLVQGRNGEAFVVTGAYGGGGDALFTVSTADGNIHALCDGNMTVANLFQQSNTPVVISADQLPWVPPTRSVIRLTSSATFTIRTILAPAAQALGQTPMYRLINANAAGGGFTILFEESDVTGAGTAADRVITAAGLVGLGPNDTADIWYDPTNARWRFLT